MNTIAPCVRCRGEGKLIHPLGHWVSKAIGYGPDGSRIVCQTRGCHVISPAFYGPSQDDDAIEWWNTTPQRVIELLEANNRNVEKRRELAAMLRKCRDQFLEYARQHRGKVGFVIPLENKNMIAATIAKAEVDAALADEIETLLQGIHQ